MMLRWRLLLGTVLIAGLVGLCWLDAHASIQGIWLMPLALLISILGSGELIAMMRQKGLQPHAGIIYLANSLPLAAILAFLIIAHFFNLDLSPAARSKLDLPTWLQWLAEWATAYAMTVNESALFALSCHAFGAGLLAAFVGEILRYNGPGQVTQRLAATTLVLGYVGVLICFVVQLRMMAGMAPLLSLIAVVKMCDIGAYTVGRLIGRHKMTPLLSPGKTWEGAVGGLAFACLGAWLAIEYLPDRFKDPSALVVIYIRPNWLLYGVVVGVTGIFGDLAESLLKRDLGCKDSSTWMPGFGGVLDIMDSILFAAPVAYLFWALSS